MYKKEIFTPLGTLIAVADKNSLYMLDFSDSSSLERDFKEVIKQYPEGIEEQENPILSLLEQEITLYFEGKLHRFSVPLSPIGTPFQKQTWEVLLQIPHGEVISYQEQAQRLGNPKAVRAVAGANGRNKIVILIPCHRVVGSNATLTGYSSGLWRKQQLLALEGIPSDEKYRLCPR